MENPQVQDNEVQPDPKADKAANKQADKMDFQQFVKSGEKAAISFMAYDLKAGEAKKALLVKAAGTLDTKAKLEAWLDGFKAAYLAKGASQDSANNRRSEAKAIILAFQKIDEGARNNLPGGYHDLVSACREIVKAEPAKAANNKAEEQRESDKERKQRSVGAKQVDAMAEKAGQLSLTQADQIIRANIQAMADKPGFEITLMRQVHEALLQIEEGTGDEFWKQQVKPLLDTVSDILAAAKRSAEEAVNAAHRAKQEPQHNQPEAAHA